MIHEELKFSRYFTYNANLVLKGSSVIQKEFSLYPAYRVFQIQAGDFGNSEYKSFGRIDFVMNYKKHTYVVEVKYYPYSSGEFWDAMKVLGYTEYFMFQTGMKDIKPAIFMPVENIKLEHQYICSRLKITLFGIVKNEEEQIKYKLIPMGDQPYYKTTGKR